MKFLFDIGHPAEFHYFKHVIRNLEKKNHQVLVTARDKDVTLELLRKSGMDFICTGRNVPSRMGKIFSLFRNDFHIYRAVRKFKPDLIVNFFSPFAAHAGWLLRRPVIGFHDTEIATVTLKMAQPFTDAVVVPECYTLDLPVEKTIRFKGYFELCHLHPRYFSPDPSVLDMLGIDKTEKMVLIRFVSRHAMHDAGLAGLEMNMKRKAVWEFSKISRVFISSEEKLPLDLEKFRILIPPEKMHDILFYSSLCFGESATMSAESAVLGTPAVYLDDRGRGYTADIEKKYGLVFNFSLKPEELERAVQKGIEIIGSAGDKTWQARRERLLSDHIDASAFMLWFIEQYPESFNIMKENPAYQFTFK